MGLTLTTGVPASSHSWCCSSDFGGAVWSLASMCQDRMETATALPRLTTSGGSWALAFNTSSNTSSNNRACRHLVHLLSNNRASRHLVLLACDRTADVRFGSSGGVCRHHHLNDVVTQGTACKHLPGNDTSTNNTNIEHAHTRMHESMWKCSRGERAWWPDVESAHGRACKQRSPLLLPTTL